MNFQIARLFYNLATVLSFPISMQKTGSMFNARRSNRFGFVNL
jgi:hypothetical protein